MYQKDNYIKGLILGLAAGDRIGGPIQMALELSESLYEQSGFSYSDIGRHYLKWWNKNGYDTGPTAAQVFEYVNSGMPFNEAAYKVNKFVDGKTAGCNPVHRNTVLAMSNSIPDEDLSAFARSEAAMTHLHPLAGEVSAIAVSMCRKLINGQAWQSIIDEVYDNASAEIQLTISKSLNGEIYPDGFAPHVLGAAIYFVHHGDNFDSMLESAIHFAGPANFCPVLAGSIGGSRWGESAISNSWFDTSNNFGQKIRNLNRIKMISAKLAKQWNTGK